jgi:hypothetical protein
MVPTSRAFLVDSILRDFTRICGFLNYFEIRMVSSGMLRRAALVTTDVSEELSASFIRVTRIGELGTTLVTASVVPSHRFLSP